MSFDTPPVLTSGYSRKMTQPEAARNQLGVGDSVHAYHRAPAEYAGRAGVVTESGPGHSEFRVEFEDGGQPTTAYLRRDWLELTPAGKRR